MAVLFSARPGCRETHLRRRYKNPLFPEGVRRVTQEEVNSARQADDADRVAFLADLRQLLKEVMALPVHVESDQALALKERIEQLYERGASLPGDLRQEREGLAKLSQLVMKQIWQGAKGDPYACWQLEQEETARALHWKMLEQPLVAHLLRPDSPIIPTELVPTLLSEEPEAIEGVLAVLDSSQREVLRQDAQVWLETLRTQGETVAPSIWERLQLL